MTQDTKAAQITAALEALNTFCDDTLSHRERCAAISPYAHVITRLLKSLSSNSDTSEIQAALDDLGNREGYTGLKASTFLVLYDLLSKALKSPPQPAPEVVELEAKLKEIVSDSELEAVWGNANFGGTDKREVILDTLWKVACGYGTGHTSLCICTELGLIKGYRSVKGEVTLTKKGQFYFREAFRDGYTPLHLQRQRGG